MRNHIAAFSSDGTLDADWNPNVDGPVYALAIGNNILSGSEGTWPESGSSSRQNVAALNPGFGDVLGPWNPPSKRSCLCSLRLQQHGLHGRRLHFRLEHSKKLSGRGQCHGRNTLALGPACKRSRSHPQYKCRHCLCRRRPQHDRRHNEKQPCRVQSRRHALNVGSECER